MVSERSNAVGLWHALDRGSVPVQYPVCAPGVRVPAEFVFKLTDTTGFLTRDFLDNPRGNACRARVDPTIDH